MKLVLFSLSLSLSMAFPTCWCEKVIYFVVMSQMGASCYGLSRDTRSIQIQLMCISSLSQMSHSAWTLGQLVKQSQKPYLGLLTTEMKQRRRGAEEISHWKAVLEFNPLTKLHLKTQTRCWTRREDYSQNSNYSCSQGNNGLSDPRPENHLNINMDISPQFLVPCVTFQKISWTNHCKTTKTVYQMAATD